MSPEELLATVSLNSIETFKQMDVYSMALVLWEVMSQCDVTGTITFGYSVWEHQSKASHEIYWEGVKILDQGIMWTLKEISRSSSTSDASVR